MLSQTVPAESHVVVLDIPDILEVDSPPMKFTMKAGISRISRHCEGAWIVGSSDKV
jgi:hypothetical protein